MSLTIRQAYLAMYYYFNDIWIKLKNKNIPSFDDFIDLISDVDPFLFKGSMSADPAAWEYWINCVSNVKALKDKDIKLTSEEAFQCMIIFIELYINEMNFDLKWLIEIITSKEKIYGQDVIPLIDWNLCVEKGLNS